MTRAYEYEFEIGSIVYCKTDIRQQPMQITKHLISGEGFMYQCSIIDSVKNFFPFELTAEPNHVLKTDYSD